MNVKLSIIIPAFNVGKFITECINPILEIRTIPIEVIIVNDGSTDNTREVLNTINDSRVKVINHEINKGLPAARNTGFKASSGEYIIPLDSDDIPLPETWLNLLDLLEANAETIIAYGHLQFFNDGDKFTPNHNLDFNNPSGNVLSKIVVENSFMAIGTALIKRNAIQQAGLWNESLMIGEDWEMWCRLAEVGDFQYLPRLALGYRQHKKSITKSDVLINIEMMKMPIDIIFKRLEESQKLGSGYQALRMTALSNMHYTVAMKSVKHKKYKFALSHLYISFKYKPSKILYLLNYPFRSLNRIIMHG